MIQKACIIRDTTYNPKTETSYLYSLDDNLYKSNWNVRVRRQLRFPQEWNCAGEKSVFKRSLRCRRHRRALMSSRGSACALCHVRPNSRRAEDAQDIQHPVLRVSKLSIKCLLLRLHLLFYHRLYLSQYGVDLVLLPVKVSLAD